jgi:hypothetical protein
LECVPGTLSPISSGYLNDAFATVAQTATLPQETLHDELPSSYRPTPADEPAYTANLSLPFGASEDMREHLDVNQLYSADGSGNWTQPGGVQEYPDARQLYTADRYGSSAQLDVHGVCTTSDWIQQAPSTLSDAPYTLAYTSPAGTGYETCVENLYSDVDLSYPSCGCTTPAPIHLATSPYTLNSGYPYLSTRMNVEQVVLVHIGVMIGDIAYFHLAQG